MRWVAIVVLGVTLVMAGNASAGHPLQTGFLDPGAFGGSGCSTASVLRAHTAGASIARLFLVWGQAAPVSPAKPDDPNDPAYQWSSNRSAGHKRGSGRPHEPIVDITNSPPWAHGAAVGLPGNLAVANQTGAIRASSCAPLQRHLPPRRGWRRAASPGCVTGRSGTSPTQTATSHHNA